MLSKWQWRIITDALVRLQTIWEVFHLTKTKRLEVINFKEQRYVSFVQQRLDSNIKFYINFNDEEWIKLLENMQTINESTEGCEQSDCDVCKNLKTPIVPQKKRQKVWIQTKHTNALCVSLTIFVQNAMESLSTQLYKRNVRSLLHHLLPWMS